MDQNKNASGDRLFKIISKKIKTSMVYPLSQFEILFGDLWGHGLPESELTEVQKENRKKWEECRTSILDNGHRQIRNTRTEINMYDINWKRYTIQLVPKGNFKGELK
jgi:hypothetical protein